jgi:phage antirepressor YoqD-like protein
MKNELKEVEFNGDILMATQDNETGKIYVGASWICNGIGLSKSQKDTHVQKLQNDIVLKLGCLRFQAGVFDDNNETIAIEIDYLPLWLAKISITPKMIKETPEVTQKLVSYQLKVKDVLAQAFIHKDNVNINNFQIPHTLSEALLLSANLAKENEEMKPKAEQFDLYLQNDGTLSLNQVAKSLKARRNKMMEFLRYQKVLNQDNSPSSYYSDKDYFQVKNYTVVTKDDRKYQIAITRVTTKGQDFLYRYIKKYEDIYSTFDNKYKKNSQEVNA